MAPKIPSSLKWLIDKRARLDAEIRKTSASLATVKRLLAEFATLQDDLAAIDRMLNLHETKVKIENIRPVRSHYARINLPRGELTRSILTCLRLREGVPATMSEIASFIETRHVDLQSNASNRTTFRRSVHYRLKDLYREGKLKRHHNPSSNEEGLWSLAENFTD